MNAALRAALSFASVVLPLAVFPGIAHADLTSAEINARCFPSQKPTSCFYRQGKKGQREKLLVFVHGVTSDMTKAWGEPQSLLYWPRMVTRDPRFGPYDIYMVNYGSPKLGTASDIHEIATERLEQLLEDARDYREIYFIAHSMGGLVMKAMLTELHIPPKQHELQKVKGVVMLATPSQGSALANYVRYVSRNIQFANLTTAHMNTFLKRLEYSWVTLVDARKSGFPKVSCAYETRETDGFMVVPIQSAATRCDGPVHPLDFDHVEIAKPIARDANPYKWTMTRLHDHARAVETQPGEIGKVAGRWIAAVPEDTDKKIDPHRFLINITQEGEEIKAVIDAPKAGKIHYDRQWRGTGYVRNDFLAFTYHRVDSPTAGIGNYFLIRNVQGDGLVGYVTGTDCQDQQIIRIPIVLMRDNDQTTVKDILKRYPIHLKQGIAKVMRFRCPTN